MSSPFPRVLRSRCWSPRFRSVSADPDERYHCGGPLAHAGNTLYIVEDVGYSVSKVKCNRDVRL